MNNDTQTKSKGGIGGAVWLITVSLAALAFMIPGWVNGEASPQQKPIISEVVQREVVLYKTITQSSSSLLAGQSEIRQKGISGEKVVTYRQTLKGGKSNLEYVSEYVTRQPIDEIVVIGTGRVLPKTSGDGYMNSQGNYVPSPSSNPAGATAQCADGTYSYSQGRRGTCSHHGGVSVWY